MVIIEIDLYSVLKALYKEIHRYNMYSCPLKWEGGTDIWKGGGSKHCLKTA